jgi:hypothetical protein
VLKIRCGMWLHVDNREKTGSGQYIQGQENTANKKERVKRHCRDFAEEKQLTVSWKVCFTNF